MTYARDSNLLNDTVVALRREDQNGVNKFRNCLFPKYFTGKSSITTCLDKYVASIICCLTTLSGDAAHRTAVVEIMISKYYMVFEKQPITTSSLSTPRDVCISDL